MSEEWSFEKDDFLTTTPYEALYAYHKEPFTHAAKMEELAAYSVSKGFKGFKTMYKKYVESLKAQSGTIYIDNVTNFTNQPLELNAGDWEADDSGIFKKNGYNDEVACPHPIMPVERLVNIDTGEEKLQLAFRKGTIWRKIIVSKTVLASSNKVTELAGSGIAVTSQNARAFIQYISDMENMNYYLIPEKKSIGRFGYIPDEGFSPFVDGLIFDGDANFKAMFQTVRSRGSEAKWLETAAEVREMSTTAKIILAASFASVLLEPLNCLPFFVHLWGVDSGTGKTVALMVAASVWGDPAVGAYVKTFDGTATGEDLDRKCMERGVIRRQASAAVRKGVFTSSSGAAFSVPIGTRFSGGEINYIITGALNTPGAYSLTSETPGEIGNGFYGTLLPIDFVDGLAGAELEDILIPGKDTESDDSLRERYFNSYDNQAFGGNQSDYKERVSALAGVGGVKVFRTPSGGGTVGLTIVDSEWSVPSSTLIASVQNAVDPLTDQGSGIGFAPIGHTVTVSGVTGRTINTKFKLTLENNVSWPDVQAAVTAAIRGYFQSLIKLWADSEAITVRISQIETRVLAVPGVLDVENTTLNAVGANIQLTGTEIPVLGEVSNGTA